MHTKWNPSLAITHNLIIIDTSLQDVPSNGFDSPFTINAGRWHFEFYKKQHGYNVCSHIICKLPENGFRTKAYPRSDIFLRSKMPHVTDPRYRPLTTIICHLRNPRQGQATHRTHILHVIAHA